MSAFEPHAWELPFDEAIYEGLGSPAFSLLQRQSEWQSQCLWKMYVVSCPTDKSFRPLRYNWFGALHERHEHGFVISHSSSLEPYSGRPSEFWNPQKIFNLAWQRDYLARLFWFNGEGEPRSEGEMATESLLLTARGTAAWCSYIPYNDVVAFSWNEPLSSAEFAEISAPDLWEHVQQQVDEHNSEAAFSRLFSRMQDRTRRSLLAKWKHGNEAECKSVLHDLLLYHEVWDQLPYGDKLTLYVCSAYKVELTYEDPYAIHTVDVPLLLSKDVEMVWQWFEPFEPELLTRDCVRKYMERSHLSIEVTVTRPAQHERLEAVLRWKEWLASIGEST